ncbi:short transient receptor potential channel 4, partial, partial [Paramuricea clavata]
MDCQEKPDRLDHDILKCKKKCCRLGHDIKCEEICCKRKARIDRWETVLKSYEELTKPSSMAKPTVMADDPLRRAFKLTCEINEMKKNNIEVKSELEALTKKSRQFTVDFLDACQDNEDVDVLLNFEHVKTLRDAVAVKHKE